MDQLPDATRAMLSAAAEGGFELTWNTPSPGRRAFPLRLTRSEACAALTLRQNSTARPVPWCLIDLPCPESLALLERLTSEWEPGIVCLDRLGRTTGDHGLTSEEAGSIQRSCQVRLWAGGSRLDPFRVREAVRHGCLPLQIVSADVSVDDLPPGLRGFVLSRNADGSLPAFSGIDFERRWDDGLSVLLAGSLERDLALAGLARGSAA